MIAGTFLLCVILKLSKHLLIKRTFAGGKEMNITIITSIFFLLKKEV
jgi:hypothetical protein